MARSKQSNSKKKVLLISLLVIAACGIAFAALQLTHTTHFFETAKKAKPAVTASQYTKGESSSTSPGPNNGASTPASGSPSSSGTDKSEGQTGYGYGSGGQTANPGAAPDAPTGNFVNAHHVSLSKSNSMTSNCTTSVGASCQIIFTMVGMSGMTKSLAAQTTDAGGSTYWNWKLQDIGLSAGTWSIKAVAALNGQTQTAADSMNLEISQ